MPSTLLVTGCTTWTCSPLIWRLWRLLPPPLTPSPPPSSLHSPPQWSGMRDNLGCTPALATSAFSSQRFTNYTSVCMYVTVLLHM